ncbi:molecular chaperone GrpE [Bifidobacterium adolescentis]
MKHEYTGDELAELKKIYDESGEAGLQIGEMRALRKAGLLTPDLPPEQEAHEDILADYQAVGKPTAEQAEPSKRDLILAHCRNRIDQGQPFDGKETAEALDISQKTAGNIIGQLRKEGLLPAFDQHSPRKTRKTTTTGKKKETMTTTSKLTVDKITATKLTPSDITPVGTISVGPQATADPRIIIANALVGIFDAVSALQRTAFQANDKVVYGFATKLLTGELMDIKANYSKDAK